MKVRLIFNNIIPFNGFKAITIWPWVFVRKDASKWTLTDERHETTHLCQQEEVMAISAIILSLLSFLAVVSWWWLLFAPFAFYLFYLLEWLIRIALYGFDSKLAYYNIGFEQEAYLHQDTVGYNDGRKKMAWCRYLFKKSFVRDKNTHRIVKRQ